MAQIEFLDGSVSREFVNVRATGDRPGVLDLEALNKGPQIIFKPESALPTGWHRIELDMEIASEARPQVFFNFGGGFNEVFSTRLKRQGSSRFSADIKLPFPATIVRLDPANTACSFKLNSFRMRRLSAPEVALALGWQGLRVLRHDPRGFIRRLPTFLDALRRPYFLQLRENVQTGGAVTYADWIKRHDFDPTRDTDAVAAAVAALDEKPLISVVMPVYNTPAKLLEEAIASVVGQIYPNWELCIADDCSTEPHVRPVLERWLKNDSRIKVVFREENGHISLSTNSAADLATGDWIALMDHDDVMPANALAEVALAISDHPFVDFVYSDEDKLDPDGRRVGPHFKPDWNEEMFLAHNYINHLAVYRASLFREVGGLRAGFEGSQDHDLGLRIVARTSPDRILHIPKILYHWRAYEGSGSYSDKALRKAISARQRAVQEYLSSKGTLARVAEGYFGRNRIIYDLPNPAPKVSIIIPTRDRVDLLKRSVSGILYNTEYQNFEIIIMDNDSTLPETEEFFRDIEKNSNIRIISFSGEFNFSAINNAAAELATGEVLCFLNNDTGVKHPDWLREMVSLAIQKQTGAVGAKLLYEDGRVQHAGVICGITGVAGHAFRFFDPNAEGYHARLNVAHQITAVTAACMVVEKHKFFEVRGFDQERLKVAFNDVDLCLKLDSCGYRNIYTPYAELYHFESASRGSDHAAEHIARFSSEISHMEMVWGSKLKNDRFYNVNLTRTAEDFSLRSDSAREV